MLRCITLLSFTGAVVACGGTPSTAPPIVVSPSNGGTPVADPEAIARLDEGERRIEVAAGDCAAACQGLATVTRARMRLCAPVTSACVDAERREDAARRQVASFCSPCPAIEASPP